MSASPTPGRQTDRLVWLGLALTFALVILALLLAALRLGAARAKPLPVCGQIADFALTNQAGQTVTLADLRGHPWVADVIFTRCPGPCLKMTRQMRELQDALPPSINARLLTLTTDPDFDTPPVLRAYSERFGADSNRWMFLTGPKQQMTNLTTGSLKLTAIEKLPGERQSPSDLFVHSTLFVVVDKQARLRGIFESAGAGVDPQQTRAQVLGALRQLEREK